MLELQKIRTGGNEYNQFKPLGIALSGFVNLIINLQF